MSDEKQDRLSYLGKRLDMGKTSSEKKSTSAKKKTTTDVNRKRHSVYIDTDLMNKIDDVFKKIKHEAYPAEVNKSAFLEQLFMRGLDDLETVKTNLVSQQPRT